MISLAAQNIVGVTDTAFLGRVGEVELGASALGGLFYIILFMVGYGFTTGVQILIARRYGEKNYAEIGRIFENSFYFLGLAAILVTIIIYFTSSFILKPFISSPAVFKAATTFLGYRIFGLFFASASLLFRSFYTGVNFTRYLSISAAIMAGLNIILAYALIFGRFGFPIMGIAGAAIASSISEVFSLLFLTAITFRNKKVKRYHLFQWVKPEFEIIKSTLGVSIFLMIQSVLSLSVWFVFFLIIEKMGERPLAISNIARSIYMFVMIPGWALCSVTNTLVSNVLGEGKPEQVLPVTFRIMKFSVGILLSLILLAAIFPYQVIGVYTNDEGLIKACIPTYYIILSALFIFSTMSILFNAVLGTANTKITLIIEIVTLSFYICYTWVIAIILKKPIQIVWTSEWVYAAFLGVFSYLYLKKGRWMDRKV